MMRSDKLEGLTLETLSSQVLQFEGRLEPAQLECLSDASFLGKLLVLPANVRLDWKVTLAYLASSASGRKPTHQTSVNLCKRISVLSPHGTTLTAKYAKYECL